MALFLTGRPAAAAAALEETLALAASAQPPRSVEVREAWLLRQLRAQAAALSETAEAGEPVEPWVQAAALPEPSRSALALFYALSGDVDLDLLARLLDLEGAAALAEPIGAARQALAPGEFFPLEPLDPLEPLARLHRPWGGDSEAVARAVAEATGEAATRLKAQTAFDTRWRERAEAIPLPAALQRLELPALAEAAPTGLRAVLRQPAVMAIGVALVVMAGVGIFSAMQRLDGFPGKEFIGTLVEESASGGNPALESIEPTEAGRLGDWFLLKGFENFSVPPEFEHLKAVGCRVYKVHGVPVAQLALETRDAFLFVFHPGKMQPQLDSANWVTYQQDEWAVSVRNQGETCTVVAFEGDAGEMSEFLRGAKKEAQ